MKQQSANCMRANLNKKKQATIESKLQRRLSMSDRKQKDKSFGKSVLVAEKDSKRGSWF